MVDLINGLGGDEGFGENGALGGNVSTNLAVGDLFGTNLLIGDTIFGTIEVNTNGWLTFGNSPVNTDGIEDGTDLLTVFGDDPFLAPFFADLRLTGTLPEGVTASPGGTSTGANELFFNIDVDDLDGDNDVDEVTITWDDVSPNEGAGADFTQGLNAFQVIITNREDRELGDFDVEIRYEDINFASGSDMDSNVALAGIGSGNAEDGFFEFTPTGSEAEILALETADGNTGEAGRWFFEVREGVITSPLFLPVVEVSADAAQVTEGDTGSTTVTFTVTRSDTAGTLDVPFSIDGSGANPAGSDDVDETLPFAGTVSFADGVGTETVTINVTGDTTVEADEDLTITLDPGATLDGVVSIPTDTATTTITNDDTNVAVVANAANVTEGDTGTVIVSFVVTRSGDTGDLSVPFSIDGAGANPVDSDDVTGTLPLTGTVDFTGGSLTETVTVTVTGDTDVEADEDVQITLDPMATLPAGVNITTATATTTVENDDALPVIAVVADTVEANEGDTGSVVYSFVVSRSDTNGALSVPVTIAGSGANPADSDDVEGSLPLMTTADFSDGDITATVSFAVFGDTTVEEDEQLTITLDPGNTLDGQVTIDTGTASFTILNDDAPLPLVGVGAEVNNVAEGDTGSTTVSFFVVRTDATGALSVPFSIDGSGANPANSDDVVETLPLTGTAEFADGVFTQTVTVSVTGDMTIEEDEDVTITLDPMNTLAGTVNISTGTATTTIDNDDLPPNNAPVAQDDAVSTDEDMVLMGDVLADNGSGADSDADVTDTLTTTLLSDVSDGMLTLNMDGTFTYTPDGDFNGTDSFVYTLSDGQDTDTATVTISVNAVNDDPVAQDDGFVTTENGVLISNVTADNGNGMDSDVDGDMLTTAVLADVSNGTLVLNTNGSFTYTPTMDFVGTDTFTYTLSDGNGGTDTATVSINVNADGNTPPVAQDDDFNVLEDAVLMGDLFADNGNGIDDDVDTDTITVSMNTTPANGSVTVNPDGTFSYTPDADFNGTDSFTYTITDGNGGNDMATVNITVAPVNDAPVAVNDTANTAENTAVMGDVSTNDSDVDGDNLTFALLADAADGMAVVNGDGTFTYTPDTDFVGTDSFTYTVTDGTATDTATVTVNVTGDNTPPVAVDDAYATFENQAIGDNVVVNDTDADGDDLNVVGNTDPSNGMVTFAGNVFTYTPNTDFTGTDTFTYQVSDGQATDTATVTITVNELNPGADTTLSIAPTLTNLAEGDIGTTQQTFTVTRSGQTSTSVSVGYNVVPDAGSTLTNADFDGAVLPSGTLIFNAGDLTETITLDILGDFFFEDTETFTVVLSNPVLISGTGSAALGTSAAAGSIVNDDAPATETFPDDEKGKSKGTPGDDVIVGSLGERNKVRGDDGEDVLFGGLERDRYRGEEGDDTLIGDDGRDSLRGNEGDDTLLGGNDDDKLRGDEGNDLIFGGEGDDKIRGDEGDDDLFGEGGDDNIRGGDGDDDIDGGDGDDDIRGNDGNDVITGGAGTDELRGDSGIDVFDFNIGDGTDTVRDFDADEDLIDVSDFGADVDTFAEFIALSAEVDGDVVFTATTGDALILRKTDLSDLAEDNFIFSNAG